jgi:hypothetical protein
LIEKLLGPCQPSPMLAARCLSPVPRRVRIAAWSHGIRVADEALAVVNHDLAAAFVP